MVVNYLNNNNNNNNNNIENSFSYCLYQCLLSLRQQSKEPYNPNELIRYIYQNNSNNQNEQQVGY